MVLFCVLCLWIPKAAYAVKGMAAIVVNGGTGQILHTENPHEQRQPASLTKKMTVRLLFEALERGTITLKTRFRVSALATAQAPSKLGLKAGDTISVDAIIRALMTKSANDMAVVAAEGLAGSVPAFVRMMNTRAKQLGMHRTVFQNASGLPDRTQLTTAYDMALLAMSLYRDFPQYCHYFSLPSFEYNKISHRNHNKLLGQVDGLDGIKTGYVAASGFSISTSAVRYTPDNSPLRLFVVVLGGRSPHERDKRVRELMEQWFFKLGIYPDTEGSDIRRGTPVRMVSATSEAPSFKIIRADYKSTLHKKHVPLKISVKSGRKASLGDIISGIETHTPRPKGTASRAKRKKPA